ncbi:hypothetical protein AFB00_30620 (plasmid) [Pseudonocardia sp. HH130630-07]|nr:transposase family protein [Pseudonocardia sp. HH130630-07]ANY10757.1 hypothetical protein AFB00_30620 [Pseudonocardia sp. HH130630-07]
MVAHLRKGETYADLVCGFRVGTSTVYRYLREAIELLAAMAPTLAQAIEVALGAFVILDGTLLRIDRVGMASGYDRGSTTVSTRVTGSTCRSSPTPPAAWCGSPHRYPEPATT